MFDISYYRYLRWRDRLGRESQFLDEFILLEKDRAGMIDSFSSFLVFGTAGARGLIGLGTSKMNVVTVSHLSQCYSEFLKNKFVDPSIVISYDTRKFSKEFAITSSEVFAGNGIRVYLFKEPSPIGVLSFIIRKLKCSGGVMITASHNPPEYNGYKIYNEYGAQPVDVSNLLEIISRKDVFDFNKKQLNDCLLDGSVSYIGNEMANEYMSFVQNEVNIESLSNIDITYSPLNGCASKIFCDLFKSFKNFHVVEEQKNPDFNFSTCKRPDPQNKDAFNLALMLAESHNSDVIILNDPDGDRLGVSIRNLDSYVILSGIEIATLFLYFIVETKTINDNLYIIKSCVSGGLCDEIAKANGIKIIQTLPGFKYISREIHELEKNNNLNSFILGFEESNGFLLYPFVRDKDGVSSSVFFCKIVSYYKERNLSCIDILNMLYEKFGYRMQKNISFVETKKEKIKQIIDKFKNYFINNNSDVLFINDYQKSKRYDLRENKIEKLNIEKSDILEVAFEDSNKLFLRASGTEPLVKFYIIHTGKTKEQSLNSCKKIENLVIKIYNSIS